MPKNLLLSEIDPGEFEFDQAATEESLRKGIGESMRAVLSPLDIISSPAVGAASEMGRERLAFERMREGEERRRLNQMSTGLGPSFPIYSPEELQAVKAGAQAIPAAVYGGMARLGKGLVGSYADIPGRPMIPTPLGPLPIPAAGTESEPTNIEALMAGEEMPAISQRRLLPTAAQVALGASQGLIESAPAFAAMAAAGGLGAPTWLSGGLAFGGTEEGFSPQQAAIAALLPSVGKYSGEIAGKLAETLGIDVGRAMNLFRAAGHAAGPVGYLSAIQASEIAALPPEQRKQATIDAVAGNIGLLAISAPGVLAEATRPIPSPRLPTGRQLPIPEGARPTEAAIIRQRGMTPQAAEEARAELQAMGEAERPPGVLTPEELADARAELGAMTQTAEMARRAGMTPAELAAAESEMRDLIRESELARQTGLTPEQLADARAELQSLTQTKGVPNASEVEKAAAVYGDVRAQSESRAGQVPVEESRPGVQPQAPGRIPEAPQGEVLLTPEEIEANNRMLAEMTGEEPAEPPAAAPAPDVPGASFVGYPKSHWSLQTIMDLGDQRGTIVRQAIQALKSLGGKTKLEPGATDATLKKAIHEIIDLKAQKATAPKPPEEPPAEPPAPAPEPVKPTPPPEAPPAAAAEKPPVKEFLKDDKGKFLPGQEPSPKDYTDADIQVTVMKFPDPRIPGAVQVDSIKGGANEWSSNPTELRRVGFDIPTKEELLSLPGPKYTLEEAKKLLAQKPAEKPPVVESVPEGRAAEEEKQIALGVLQDVNRAYERGDKEFDGHPIQSAFENAIEGMKEAGWTQKEISALAYSKAPTAIEKAQEAIDEVALDPEATRGKAVKLARKLAKQGLIGEKTLREVERLGKDRDMSAEDILSEISGDLNRPKEAAPPSIPVAEGLTLEQIKRRLPIGFDPDSVRIEDGKIIATEKPNYGGREMVVSLKKATSEPYTPAAAPAAEAPKVETAPAAPESPKVKEPWQMTAVEARKAFPTLSQDEWDAAVTKAWKDGRLTEDSAPVQSMMRSKPNDFGEIDSVINGRMSPSKELISRHPELQETPPAEFEMTFEQFLSAPREGALLEALRTLPKPEPSAEQVAAKQKLDAAWEKVEKAKLGWIAAGSDAKERKNVEAAIAKLSKSKRKLVDAYNSALDAYVKETQGGERGQRALYDRAVKAGIIKEPTPETPNVPKLYVGLPFPALRPLLKPLENLRGVVSQRIKNLYPRQQIDQAADSTDTRSNNLGREMGNHIRFGKTEEQEVAASAVIAAKFHPGNLPNLLAMVAGRDAQAEAGVRYAMAHWGESSSLAHKARRVFDWQIHSEQNNGINTIYAENYLPGLYDQDVWMGTTQPFVLGKGRALGTGFKKGKTYDTPFHAIPDGFKPQSLRLGDLVEHRVKAGQRLINRKNMADVLKGINAVSDGKPIGVDVETVSRGPGKGSFETVPRGYQRREVIPGVGIGIHEDFVKLFDAVTGMRSDIAGFEPGGFPLGELALQVEGGIKHGLLIFDTFHASRIMQKQMFLTRRLPSYKKGYSLLEYSNADLGRLVAAGEITPEIEQWIRANRPRANLLQRAGLNVGRIQEAMYSGFTRAMQEYLAKAARAAGVPKRIAEKIEFNKWVFEKVTRGAMLESGLIEFERVKRANPNWTDEQVAHSVARQLNVYFGNLGRQGIFKSPTMLDASHLGGLAPQWVESMLRSEILGAYQIARAPVDSAMARQIKIGSLGTGLGQGLIAYMFATQILNLVTRGHLTFQNEEKGHKLDAWIPDLTGKGPGFFVSPMSVVAELTHDMIRYAPDEREEGGAAKIMAAMAHIGRNRMSPLARAAKIMVGGRDWDQQKIIGGWNRVKAAAWALAPTPIPLSPMIRGNAPVGQTQRQLTASMGVKTEPVKTATAQISSLARDFMERSADPKIRHKFELGLKNEFGMSDYVPLRRSLTKGDFAQAWTEYQQLRDMGKKPSDIAAVFRPYTITASGLIQAKPIAGMSRSETGKFLRTLNKVEQKIWLKSRDEQRAQYQRFQQMLREAPKPLPAKEQRIRMTS